ncbi:PAS domain S-box-containing protein/diguanylate cyclase (GGDEF) domain-containing protein [Marinitoga hydrogenitolerans DSM 16785]|uniref:PAS domain S-box-containing protein/diguanylate cyclase (GGDEF) domain-containing protein n=1 Tax=Marinitoga hydrogenitolerans (strain DSM 16785 / JCM 12826 / AT1271) TaxID=1122195 RepID=A0A1M4V8E6_MARH1|nr:sensor domain-containing diguanylate cyclase [Marinitoga hydrogenitolerans]SHE65153.1 PAS domain S-box-containing protein/diguanylate cyclase (GGDEF) domain-containing protein [Marinitoga hydrogenitolerans DSM 16785]
MKDILYKGLFDYTDNAIFYWNKHLKLIKANKRAAELLGYTSPDEMIGISYEKHIYDTEIEILERIKKAIENKTFIQIFEKKYISKHGKIRWVEVHISPILLKNNDDYIIQEIAYDITERKKLESQLDFEKRKFENYFNLSQTINIVLDKNGNIYDINNKACELLNVNKKEIIGSNWFDNFIEKEFKDEIKSVFFKIINNEIEQVEFYENEIVSKNGEKYLVSWHNGYIEENGRIKYIISSGIDRTKEKIYITQLEYNNILSTELLKLSNEIISFGYTDDLYKKILDKLVEVLPHAEAGSFVLKNGDYYEYKAVNGFDFDKLKKIKFQVDFESFLKDSPSIVTQWKNFYTAYGHDKFILKKYGKIDKIKETLVIPLYIKNLFYGFVNFDTFTKSFDEIELNFAKVLKSNLEFLLWKIETDKKLKYAAEYDFLTKIYNRQTFISKTTDLMKFEKRHKEKIAFIYMDINKFKQINDKYGHKIGDEVLKFFAEKVSSILRESDIFGRVGGDEFIISLPNTDKNGAEKVIEKINKALLTPFKYNNIEIYLSISYGYSIFPQDSEDINKLFDIADKRMYKNKKKYNEKK